MTPSPPPPPRKVSKQGLVLRFVNIATPTITKRMIIVVMYDTILFVSYIIFLDQLYIIDGVFFGYEPLLQHQGRILPFFV